MRWHVRAYCEKNRQYRDFVLSRLRGQPELLDKSHNGADQDVDWNTDIPVILTADLRLTPEQKAIIETDFAMVGGQLRVPSRRALVKYVLQRYQIDPRSHNPKAAAQQIVVQNLEALKPWLYD